MTDNCRPDFEAKARSLLNNGYSDGEVKVLAEAFRAMYEAGKREGFEEYVNKYGDPRPMGGAPAGYYDGRTGKRVL